MAPATLISLSDYKAILVAHERDYRSSKGDARQDVLDQIIEEIASQGKGKFVPDAVKSLKQVSQLFNP